MRVVFFIFLFLPLVVRGTDTPPEELTRILKTIHPNLDYLVSGVQEIADVTIRFYHGVRGELDPACCSFPDGDDGGLRRAREAEKQNPDFPLFHRCEREKDGRGNSVVNCYPYTRSNVFFEERSLSRNFNMFRALYVYKATRNGKIEKQLETVVSTEPGQYQAVHGYDLTSPSTLHLSFYRWTKIPYFYEVSFGPGTITADSRFVHERGAEIELGRRTIAQKNAEHDAWNVVADCILAESKVIQSILRDDVLSSVGSQEESLQPFILLQDARKLRPDAIFIPETAKTWPLNEKGRWSVMIPVSLRGNGCDVRPADEMLATLRLTSGYQQMAIQAGATRHLAHSDPH